MKRLYSYAPTKGCCASTPGARRHLCILVLALTQMSCDTPAEDRLDVFAAASLAEVIQAAADSFFVARSGGARTNAAASSVLARQIERGARADIFVSADTSWTAWLVERGIARDWRILPFGNRLVAVRTPAATAEGPISTFLSARRLALADPDHVPAGRYAKSLLECLGVWTEVEERVVPTLDVRAALAGVVSGSADVGIVYATDITERQRRTFDVHVTELPASCQPRIAYGILVPLSSGRPDLANSFADFLMDERNSLIWTTLGFHTN